MKGAETKFFLFTGLGLLALVLGFGAAVYGQGEDDDPVDLFNRGQDAHEKGDFTKALEFYDAALKIHPEFPEAEYQKGSALRLLKRNKEAESSFRKAIELKPDWALPVEGLCTVLLDNGRSEEALGYLKQLLKTEPISHAALEMTAQAYSASRPQDQDLRDLLTKLTVATQSGSSPASLWAARASIEIMLSDVVSAGKSITRSLEIDPNESNARIQLISLLMLSKDYEKAVTEARALEKRLPDSRNVKLLLARSLAGFGKAEEALKILDNLPTGSDVEKLRTAIVNSGTQDAATLENELTKDPNNINLLANLCRVTRTVPAKALDYCKRAAQLEPDNIDHAIGYGAALVQAREFAQAIALLRKLSALKPDRRSIHANLATSLFAVDQFELAKKEFEWLIANDPGVPITYYFLAISHDNLGEYRQALENYQQFLKLADLKVNQLEVDKVNLRLPSLQRQIKEGKGKKP